MDRSLGGWDTGQGPQSRWPSPPEQGSGQTPHPTPELSKRPRAVWGQAPSHVSPTSPPGCRVRAPPVRFCSRGTVWGSGDSGLPFGVDTNQEPLEKAIQKAWYHDSHFFDTETEDHVSSENSEDEKWEISLERPEEQGVQRAERGEQKAIRETREQEAGGAHRQGLRAGGARGGRLHPILGRSQPQASPLPHSQMQNDRAVSQCWCSHWPVSPRPPGS